MSSGARPWDYDVIEIGFGPVGQTMAALLGQRGYRVGVFERWPQPYPLPRAGHVDHEIMRILQSLGVAEEFEPKAIPVNHYDWFNGEGERLLHLNWDQPTPSGWKLDYLMFQPDLQDALLGAVQRHQSVDLQFGWMATEVHQFDDHVEVALAHGTESQGQWVPSGRTKTVTAAFLIGADGANSLVRQSTDLAWVDRGFEEQWLVIDVKPHDPELEIDIPEAGQYCDPNRPISLFRWLGRAHARWEFMLLPGETETEMTDESTCWQLLSRWNITPDNVTMIRRTVYRFRSLLAERWRSGRLILIGDAAHVMPPFLGQGMCSGLRDAINLAWKLGLVLDGHAAPSLLDTYAVERQPHVEAIINLSVALGSVVCISDHQHAAARDAAFKSGVVPPIPPFPSLTSGIFHRDANGQLTEAAGKLSLQPRVHFQGRTSLLDDAIGWGWTLLCRLPDTALNMTQAHRDLLDALGARTAHLTRAQVPGAVIDMDGAATQWFDELNADAVLVRPDFYVYGAARNQDLPSLLDSLNAQLESHRLIGASL